MPRLLRCYREDLLSQLPPNKSLLGKRIPAPNPKTSGSGGRGLGAQLCVPDFGRPVPA